MLSERNVKTTGILIKNQTTLTIKKLELQYQNTSQTL
jgi:hypothetical protein